jgi:hypothetical protein
MTDRPVLWAPHPGPQSTFLASDAYEALYGGAAGGGKSDALLFGSLRQIDHPQYKALILRRTFPELRELMDRAHLVFRQIGGVWNEQAKRYTFPTGATVEFGYCETYSDVQRYQGQQYTYIAFDELGQVPEERIWTYLMSRNRTASAGLVKQMRASANPGGPGHHWLKRRFIHECPPNGSTVSVSLRDGSTSTRAFVQAFLSDNPTLMANDPTYGQRLSQLPDLEYRWLAAGDWDAGAGLGLSDLKRSTHLIAARPIPEHWTLFGAFDWGYAHPFSFGLFAADEDGSCYLVDSCSARRMQPPEIAERITDCLAGRTLRYIWAGHDCWADVRARAENIPTIAEHFARLGLPLVKANISRVSGVQNVRRYLAAPARFYVMDTPSNRKVFECLESLVGDPDKPEDILKVDADENGEGGDDAYDMVRYGLASRPTVPVVRTIEMTKDRGARIDYATGRVKPKETADQELERMLQRGLKRARPYERPRFPA